MRSGVTGVIELPTTLYYIAIGDDTGNNRIQVTKEIHQTIMESLSKGAHWEYDEETNSFLKYSQQLELFDLDLDNENTVNATIIK